MKTLNEKWTMDEMTALAKTVAEDRNMKFIKKSGCWIQLTKTTKTGKVEEAVEFEFSRFADGRIVIENRGTNLSSVPLTGEAWKTELVRLKKEHARKRREKKEKEELWTMMDD